MTRSGSKDKPGPPRWLDAPGEDPPRRAPLNRRRIVEGALAIIDELGLSALTIRRLAGALGVSPMALYSHVADKAEVIDLVVDHVVGTAWVERDPDLAWADQLRAICTNYRATWQQHPGLIHAYASDISLGPNAIRQAEQLLEILHGAGFDPPGQARAFLVIYSFLLGNLNIAPSRLETFNDGPEVDRQAMFERFLGDNDPASLPRFVAAAPYLMGADTFEYGLEVLLKGLAASLAEEARPPRDD